MYTAELRWFFEQPLTSSTLLQAFPHRNLPLRHDYYLLHTGENLGIKWRAGHMEAKQRQGSRQPFAQGAISGMLEFWKKWSFALQDQEDIKTQLHTPYAQHWIKISKNRSLILFAADRHQHSVKPVTESGADDQCQLEITRIEAAGKIFHTLGLEASGTVESLQENLRQTVEFIQNSINLEKLGLSTKQANSYPGWIEQTLAQTDSNRFNAKPQNEE